MRTSKHICTININDDTNKGKMHVMCTVRCTAMIIKNTCMTAYNVALLVSLMMIIMVIRKKNSTFCSEDK